MRFLAFLLFLLFLLFAIFTRWFFICDILQICGEEVPEVVEEVRPQTLRLTQEDSVLLQGYDEFLFAPDSSEVKLNDNNRAFLDTLRQLMAADSTVDLEIYGRLSEQEKGIMAGFYEDLGIARAAAVQDLLLAAGVDDRFIKLKSELSLDSIITEPLRFNFAFNQGPEEYATVTYLFNNMNFSDDNFPSDSDVFDPSDAFIAYADSVKTYVELNPEKQIRIIGHTDNVDTDEYNLDLGLRRAKSAREWMLEHGVNCEILVESKGEEEPVATNETDEGKQANRRVNLVIF